MTRRILLILISLIVMGCTHASNTPTTVGVTRTAQSEDTRVALTVYADHDQLRTIDQCEITIELTHDLGVDCSLIEPDWDASGWTLIASRNEPEQLVDDRMMARWIYTIEPFLEGDYTIPQIIANTQSGTIATEPITIDVTSVLASDDANDLAPMLGTALPDTPTTPMWKIVLVISSIVGVLLACIVLWWTDRGSSTLAPTPIDQLHDVVDGKISDPREAFARVHHAIESVEYDTRLNPIRVICERVRFGSSQDTDQDEEMNPRALAAEALRILEDAA